VKRSMVHCPALLALLALFFAVTMPANAQSVIDSLRQEFTAANSDSSRALLCHRIAKAYQAERRKGEAISWFERCVTYALPAGLKRTAAFTMRVLGGSWWQGMDNPVRAIEAYDRSLRLYEEIDDTVGMVWTHCNIGTMHMSKGDYTQTLRYYHRAYDMAEAVGNIGLLAAVLRFIGVAYDFMGDKEEGIACLRRCLALREQIGDPRHVESTLIILAAICTNGGHYDESLSYLARSKAIADSLGDRQRIATNYHSVGRIYRDMGDTVTAIDYEQRALALYQEIDDLRDMNFTLHHLGTLYSRLGKADSAMHFYEAALEVVQRRGSRGSLRQHYRLLAEHHARMGDFGKAIAFRRRFTALKDSLLNEQAVRRINELTAAYEAERRERIITLLRAERSIDSLELLQRERTLMQQRLLLIKQRQEKELLAQENALQRLQLARAADTLNMHAETIARRRAESAKQQRRLQLQQATLARDVLNRNSLLGGLAVTLLLALLFLRALRSRRVAAELRTEAVELHVRAAEAMAAKQQAEIAHRESELQRLFTTRLIDSQEQERKRIAGALHDGIGQDLLIIKHRALMALDDTEQRRTNLDDITHIAIEAVEDVRQLCRDLSPYQLERVGLTNTLRDMLASVEKSTALTMHADIEQVDGLIPAEREIDLYRVVQEGINNIIKHAEAHEVEVTLQRVNGGLRLRIHDDGKGLDTEKHSDPAAQAGLGMQGMTERMHLLGGEIRFESSAGQGTLAEALIPLATATVAHEEDTVR